MRWTPDADTTGHLQTRGTLPMTLHLIGLVTEAEMQVPVTG
jgi:hypothetical protein